ncbi:phage portal protein [bacterium]|nr:phage portal protein [bacterium]
MGIKNRLRKWLDVPAPRKKRKRSFAGAKHSNVLSGWVFAYTQINDILKADLPTLRTRSRDLCRNNFLVKAFLNQAEVNVIGPRNIRLQSKVTARVSTDLDEVVNRVVEENWHEFTRTCDLTKRGGMQEFDTLALKSLVRDGEVFIRRQRGWTGNRFRYGIKVVDACLVDDQLTKQLTNGNSVVNGVEVDAMDVPVAYWLKTKSLGGVVDTMSTDHSRIPAEDMIHVFIQDEPGQTRGAPWTAPAMISLKHLDGFMEAAIVNARSKALCMGFLSDQPGEETDDLEGDTTGGDGETIFNMEAGTIREIGAKQFQKFEAAFPSDIDGFVKSIEKAITSSLPGSYASVSGDIENASWSALRNDEMRAKSSWSVVQQYYIRNVRTPIWEDWLQQALLTGQIRLGEQRTFLLSDYDRLNKPMWFPPVYPSADELKRQNANKLRIEMGTASRAEVIAEEGKDMFDVDASRRASQESEEGIDPVETEAPAPQVMPEPEDEEAA